MTPTVHRNSLNVVTILRMSRLETGLEILVSVSASRVVVSVLKVLVSLTSVALL